MSETFTFQAEIKQLLHTLVHSLYKDREIFLRELISNSSDALHRIKFEMLTNRAVRDPEAELGIWIETDEEAGTLTIIDTGIGMTRDELIENLGTISRSGIKSFLERVKNNGDEVAATDLIGQFGVGFYSIFMVADRVEVTSCSYDPDEPAQRWVAEGDETYSIEPVEMETRGTAVKLFLSEDAREFAQPGRIRQIIRRHSNYIPFPIYIRELATEDDDEDQPLEPVNEQQALWRRLPDEVTEEEYHQFYRGLTLDPDPPLLHTHIRAEGMLQFYGVLYVPSNVERPIFSPRQEPGLQLYARKVLIQDFCTDLLPEYLHFVQGVVDSEDLPLNVSRETVQANRVMVNLKKAVTGRVLRTLEELAEDDPARYVTFWEQFGAFIKHGVVTDFENKDRLTSLLRFHSTHSPDELTSLDDYVERMQAVEGQEAIYYVIADSDSAAARSPHLEPFQARDIEVLYFTDTVDSFLVNALLDYEGHSLQNVDDEDLDLSEVGQSADDEDAPEKLDDETLAPVLERFETVLGDRVAAVRTSKVLSGKNPARLVSPEGSLDRHTQQVYRMMNRDFDVPPKILEINPSHVLTHNVAQMVTNGGDDPLLDMTIEQIYENALLLDGLHPNPAEMVARIQALLEKATKR